MHPWRAAALYSFALYLVASLFLVVLPPPDLPARRAEPAAWEAQFGRLRTPGLDPTASIRAAVTGAAGLRAVFQVLFNLALLAPLGVYFRWLFGLRAWTSALAGFVVSLAFGIDFFGFASSVLCLVEVADLLGLLLSSALPRPGGPVPRLVRRPSRCD